MLYLIITVIIFFLKSRHMRVLLYFWLDLSNIYRVFILHEGCHRCDIKRVLPVAFTAAELAWNVFYTFNSSYRNGWCRDFSHCQPKQMKFDVFYVIYHNNR